METVKQFVDDISKGLNTVICDSEYNTRRIVELSDSAHDRLSPHDMSHFLELLSTLMDLQRIGLWMALNCSSRYGMNCGSGRPKKE